jgi:hypothetical protein
LRAHFGDTIGNLLVGIKDFQVAIDGGCHGDSIARKGLAGEGFCAKPAPAVRQTLA